jgi:hypothetical protein
MVYGKGRIKTDENKPKGKEGDGRFYAGGPGFGELNNLTPGTRQPKPKPKPERPIYRKGDRARKPIEKTPGRKTIQSVPLKMRNILNPIGKKPGRTLIDEMSDFARKQRQLPTRVKPEGQRRKASDMGKTANNGRSRRSGGR